MKRYAPFLAALLFLVTGLAILGDMPRTPRLVAEVALPGGPSELVVHRDGKRFAVAHSGGISLFDRAGRELAPGRAMPYAQRVVFTTDGELLFASSTRSALILDASTLEPVAGFPSFAGTAGMSADGHVVVTAHNMLDDRMEPETTTVACYRDGKEFLRFERPGGIQRVDLTANGRYLRTTSWTREPEFGLFDLQTRQQLARRGSGHADFARDGRRMVQQAHTNQVVLLDLDARRAIAGPVASGTSGRVSFSPADRSVLTSASWLEPERAGTWEAARLKPVAKFEPGGRGGSAWLGDDHVLSYLFRGGEAVAWDARNGKPVAAGMGGLDLVNGAAGGPGWAVLAGTKMDRGALRIWTW